MSIIIPANSAVGGGFEATNGLRFDQGSSAYLKRSLGTTTSQQKGTFSYWVKRSDLGDGQQIYSNEVANDNNRGYISFESNDSWRSVIVASGSTEIVVKTNRLFRDVSAWYHIVVRIDTTQSTSTNRLRLYVNGVQETSFETYQICDQNATLKIFEGGQTNKNLIGGIYASGSASNYLGGYLSEFVYCDGQTLDPTSFGEFDEDSGVWKAINVSGLTFGNMGFYLDFEDSSALGNDAAGSNNWSLVNLTAIDQTTDTCTNNFATVNSLDNFYEASTFSEGNLKIVTESGDYSYNTSTIGLSSGKWYCEVFVEGSPTGNASIIGIAGRMSEASLGFLGGYLDTYGFYGANGNMYNIGGNGVTSYGSGYGVNSVIGIYMDLDNNKLYFAINGSIQNSGTGYTILAPNLTKAGFYFPAAADNYNGSSGTFRLNFGNPIYALTSANTDVNGYGSFEYDPSSGTFDGASKDFLAICTKNLSEVNS